MKTSASRAVGDPDLAAAQHVGVAVALGPGRQRERVAAGFRLGQRVGAEPGRRETGQDGRLLRRRAPAQQRVDDQRVVDVDDHADGRVDARQLFDGEGRVEEGAAGAAVDLGHLDAHDAQVEERPQQVAIERLLLVHGPRERGDPVHREFADAVAEEPLVVGERRKGRGRNRGCVDRLGHGLRGIMAEACSIAREKSMSCGSLRARLLTAALIGASVMPILAQSGGAPAQAPPAQPPAGPGATAPPAPGQTPPAQTPPAPGAAAPRAQPARSLAPRRSSPPSAPASTSSASTRWSPTTRATPSRT